MFRRISEADSALPEQAAALSAHFNMDSIPPAAGGILVSINGPYDEGRGHQPPAVYVCRHRSPARKNLRETHPGDGDAPGWAPRD
jgi:hypothetical protein